MTKIAKVAGNAAYILGAILDTEVGKDKVYRMFSDPSHLNDNKHVLPNLAALIETDDIDAATNASGTLAVIVETEAGRNWALKQPSFDWVLHVWAKKLTEFKYQPLVASNCSLCIARTCLNTEGCARILSIRNFDFILTQLITVLGIDRDGVGMNCAFALSYLCELETGLNTILHLKESNHMITSLITMLCGADEGCSKNACFCIKNIAKQTIGQDRLLANPDLDRILRTLSLLLTSSDEETATFSAIALRNLASHTPGYLREKDHKMVKPTLRHVLSKPNLSADFRNEARKSLDALLLPAPDPPKLKVIDAHTIIVSWDILQSRSGLPVTYELYLGDEKIYNGRLNSFTVTNLDELSEYEFRLRIWTAGDEESMMSQPSSTETCRAVSSQPRGLRATSITASQIKIAWNPPERIYGVLNGYKVRDLGKDIQYEPIESYHTAGNLNAETEYSFEVSAITKRGEGERAHITIRTLRQDHYSPSKPDLIVVGSHEILVKWEQPTAPNRRINAYEVLLDGKRFYYGTAKSCLVNMLKPATTYSFAIVAWTNEGRCVSESVSKKTPAIGKAPRRVKPWKTKEELLSWLEIHEGSVASARSFESSSSRSMVSQQKKSDSARGSTRSISRSSSSNKTFFLKEAKDENKEKVDEGEIQVEDNQNNTAGPEKDCGDGVAAQTADGNYGGIQVEDNQSNTAASEKYCEDDVAAQTGDDNYGGITPKSEKKEIVTGNSMNDFRSHSVNDKSISAKIKIENDRCQSAPKDKGTINVKEKGKGNNLRPWKAQRL